jgi:paraquat-inducible protein A
MTIACPDCGTLQELPRLRRGDIAVCPRCEARLERVSARSINAALACALTALLLLFPANLLTLLQLRLADSVIEIKLASGIPALAYQGWPLLAALVCAMAIVLPFVRYALLVYALGGVAFHFALPWRGGAFRWALLLDRWSQPEIFLVACITAYARVRAQASSVIYVGAGGYCFLAAALMAMLARALLDRRSVWRALAPERTVASGEPVLSCTACNLVLPLQQEGQPCPRCGHRLRARLPGVRERTLALLAAGCLLYVPANVFPMNITYFMGAQQSYRIVDGVMALFGAGLWPLGVLICATSIAVPIMKLLGLGYCLQSIYRRSSKRLVLKTKIYRLIDETGRWSNTDPFIIAVIVPLMHFHNLVTTTAGLAATAFYPGSHAHHDRLANLRPTADVGCGGGAAPWLSTIRSAPTRPYAAAAGPVGSGRCRWPRWAC